MQIAMLLLCYVLGLGSLALLAWRDPQRLASARQRDSIAPLSGWRRAGLAVFVAAPVMYTLWLGNWAGVLIAAGLTLCAGWGLALCFSVRRGDNPRPSSRQGPMLAVTLSAATSEPPRQPDHESQQATSVQSVKHLVMGGRGKGQRRRKKPRRKHNIHSKPH